MSKTGPQQIALLAFVIYALGIIAFGLLLLQLKELQLDPFFLAAFAFIYLMALRFAGKRLALWLLRDNESDRS